MIEEPGGVSSRLAELGIPDQELLRQAISEGEVARTSFHKNVPAMAIGLAAWGVTVGAVRNLLAPHNWVTSSEGRLETTLNLTTRVAIAVTAGDEATGRAQGMPKTKHKKGIATETAIKDNVEQLSLLARLDPQHPAYEPGPKPKLVVVSDDSAGVKPEAGDVPDGVMLWVLLKVRDGDEIRCELSLPAGYGVDGHVHWWAERIILAPIELDGRGKSITPVEPTPDIDVQVTRRTQGR